MIKYLLKEDIMVYFIKCFGKIEQFLDWMRISDNKELSRWCDEGDDIIGFV